VFVASNGIEGLALIEQERPDLILTDIRMPECDGFQLAAAVKANPILSAIPIIFITAFAQKYDIEEAKQYNPIGYLIKPFEAPDLRAAIAASLVKSDKKGET
jgi:Response regulator containing CheY-like receiver domain and AraC-type DNA-binding domain